MKKICCDSNKKGMDHKACLSRVNRIGGQIEGIARMINEQAYCPEIITQIQAARSALGSLQAILLSGHLKECVTKGMRKGDGAGCDNLINELVGIFKHS